MAYPPCSFSGNGLSSNRQDTPPSLLLIHNFRLYLPSPDYQQLANKNGLKHSTHPTHSTLTSESEGRGRSKVMLLQQR